jgi:hypothetical protein
MEAQPQHDLDVAAVTNSASVKGVFTAGAAPFKVDRGGRFEVEQMNAQYVKRLTGDMPPQTWVLTALCKSSVFLFHKNWLVSLLLFSASRLKAGAVEAEVVWKDVLPS